VRRYNAIIDEELEFLDCGSVFMPLGTDIVLPYFTHIATTEQQQRWLPRIVKDKLILAVAMSEPEAGSDLIGISATGG
jgi:acyl-CoA dehydrogenase